ncbi:DprA-like winged helix domain-containing protein [Gordonia sputi]
MPLGHAGHRTCTGSCCGLCDPGRGRDRPTDMLTDDEKRVHDAIPGQGSATITEISFAAGLDVGIVRAALAGLEIAGLIAGDGAGWRLAI